MRCTICGRTPSEPCHPGIHRVWLKLQDDPVWKMGQNGRIHMTAASRRRRATFKT